MIIPFKIIINKLLVALDDPLSFEKGAGWIIPFNKSELLKISNEFLIKNMNSFFPIKMKNIKIEKIIKEEMTKVSLNFLFTNNIKKKAM